MARTKDQIDRGEVHEELSDAVDSLVWASNLLARKGLVHHAERASDLALLINQLATELRVGALKS